ncbi:SRP54-type, GTPase domain protein, partial [Chlamydia psittaci 03DC29]
SCCYCL